ncbi:hypothetical protein BN1221_03392 [Brenneria goodwinii]|uniref:Uncharacterized protein n=1 Tax=Brenneria goodwinii TaxID=1109412 RepID=A0A0G4JYG8_9GAMM|nr:hypothetical protein BN1221_03392 [Brenneria goodwinii]
MAVFSPSLLGISARLADEGIKERLQVQGLRPMLIIFYKNPVF